MSRTSSDSTPVKKGSGRTIAGMKALLLCMVIVAAMFIAAGSISNAGIQDDTSSGGVITYHPSVEGENEYSIAANGKYLLPENWFVSPGGRAFTGWSVQMGGDERIMLPGDVIDVTGDVSICPVWEPLVRVTFDKNGGTGAMDSVLYESNEVRLPNCEFFGPANEYFSGWTIEEKVYQPGDLVAIDHNVQATATWSDAPVVWTITFDADEGSGSMSEVKIDSTKNQYVLPECGFTAPDGKYFAYWTVGNDGTKCSPWKTITVSGNTTITAHWDTRDNVVMIHYLVNGTYEEDGTEIPASGSQKDVTIGKTVTDYWLPDCEYVPEQRIPGEIISFKCWDLTGMDDKSILENQHPDKPIKISAYSETYSEMNMHHRYQSTTNSVEFILDEGRSLNYIVGYQFKIPNVPYEKQGYAFAGWHCSYNNYDGTLNSGSVIQSGKNDNKHIVLEPIWVKEKISISINNTIVETMATYVLPDYQTNGSDTFEGWEISGVTYQPGDNIPASAGVNVIVQPSTRSLQEGDVSITVEGDTYKVAPGSKYILGSLSKSDQREFRCWSINGEERFPGEVMEINSDITITAEWKNPEYILTFKDGGSEQKVQIRGGCDYHLPECMFKPGSDEIFSHWVINDVAKQIGEKITIDEDTVITANWEDGSGYVVTLDPNGEKGVSSVLDVKSSKYLIPNCTFDHPQGKCFNGWNLAGDIKNPGEVIDLTGNITLTAQWADGNGYDVIIGSSHDHNVDIVHNEDGSEAQPVTITTYYGMKSTEYNPEFWSGTGEVPDEIKNWVGPSALDKIERTFSIDLHLYMAKSTVYYQINVPNDDLHSSKINSLTFGNTTVYVGEPNRTITNDNRTVELDLGGKYFRVMNNNNTNVFTVTLNVTSSLNYQKVFGGWLDVDGGPVMPGDIVDYKTTDLYAKWITPDVFIPKSDNLDLRALESGTEYELDLITPYANLTVQFDDETGNYNDGKLEAISLGYPEQQEQHSGNYSEVIPGDGRTAPDMFGTIYVLSKERTYYGGQAYNKGVYWADISGSKGSYLKTLPAGTYRSLADHMACLRFGGSGHMLLSGNVIIDNMVLSGVDNKGKHGDSSGMSLYADGNILILGTGISNARIQGSTLPSEIAPQIFGGAIDGDITNKVVEGKEIVFSNKVSLDVLFYSNGGTGSMSGIKVVQASEYLLPECGFTAPQGKAFAGWIVNGELKSINEQITVKEDTTVWAKWDEEPCTISISGNTFELASGSSYILPNYAGTENGFKCWSVDGELRSPGDKIIINGDISIQPSLGGASTFTVSFGGGTGSMGSLKISNDASFVLPNNGFDVPNGKVFAGWNLNGTNYSVGDLISGIKSDMQFTAVWADVESLQVDLGTYVIIHSGSYYNVIAGSFGSGGYSIGTNENPLSTYLVLKGGVTLDTVAGGSSGGKGYVHGHINGKDGYMDGGTFVYLLNHYTIADDYEEKKSGWYDRIPGRDLYVATQSSIIEGGASKGADKNNYSKIDGSTHIFITGNSNIWDAQAGGRTGTTMVDSSYLEVGGKAVVRHIVCGTITDGSNTGLSTVGETHLFIGGDSTVANVFGAGYDTWAKPEKKSMTHGSIEVTILDGQIGNVYGGGYRGSIGDGNLTVKVDVLGGEVGYVYGGGSGGLDKINHNANGTFINGNGKGYTWSMGRSIVHGDIYVTIGGDATILHNVYGGGMSVPKLQSYNDINNFESESGNKEGNTPVEVAAVVGNTYVNIVGSPTINGSVYGGGRGIEVEYSNGDYTFENMTEMNVVGYSNEESLHFTTIPWFVDENGTYTYTYDTTLCNGGSGTGLKEDSRYLNCAKVIGNSQVTVSMDGGIIKGSVYGGAALGKVTKDTAVNVKSGNLQGDVYGGGEGRSDIISVYGDRVVYIEGNDDENTGDYVHGVYIQGSVYGGSMAGVDGTHTGTDANPELTDKMSLVVIYQGKVDGSVFGGGLKGKTYGDAYVYVGYELTSMKMRAPVISTYPDDGKLNISLNSVYAGGNISISDEEEIPDPYTNYLVMGKGTVRIHGNANNSIGISGSIMGSGNACLTKGETYVELSNFYNASVLTGIHRASSLVLDNTVLKVEGRNPLTPIAGQTKICSIYGIGVMTMRNGASVAIDYPIDNVGALNSMTSTGGFTSKTSPENRIVFSSGPTVYIRTVNGDDIQYGKVTGYIMMGVTNQQSYGAYVMGHLTSQGGFVVADSGNFRETEISDSGDVRCWFVSGIEKKIVVMEMGLDNYDPEHIYYASSHVEIVKVQPTTDLVYTGGIFTRMATDSSSNPYKFVVPKADTLGGTDMGLAIGYNHGNDNDLYDPTDRQIYLLTDNGQLIQNPKGTYFSTDTTGEGGSLISNKMVTESSQSPGTGVYNIWFQMTGKPENMTAYLGYVTLNFHEVRKVSYEVETETGTKIVEKDLVSNTIEVQIDMYIRSTNEHQHSYYVDLKTTMDGDGNQNGSANAMLPKHGQLTTLYLQSVEPVKKVENGYISDEDVTISGTFFMKAESNFDNTTGWSNIAPTVTYDLATKKLIDNDGYVGTMLGSIYANASQGVIDMKCTKDGHDFYPVLKVTVRVAGQYEAYVYLTLSGKQEYTVTFMDQGVAGYEKISENELLTRDLCPPPSGPNFNGWYLDEDFVNRYDYNLRVTDDNLILYARYMFEVTFDNMDGTKSVTYIAQEDSGARLISETTPTPVRDGYIFGGWYKDSSFVFKWDYQLDRVTSDTVLYAKWIGKDVRINFWYYDEDGYLRLFEGGEYTIVYDIEGDSSHTAFSKDAGEIITLPEETGGQWILLTGDKTPEISDGKYTVRADDCDSGTKRIVLRYGQSVNENKYHVVFETRFGLVPVSSDVGSGASVQLPIPKEEDDNQKLVGWKIITGNGTHQIITESSHTISSSDASNDNVIIFKAIWNEKKYDLSRGYMMNSDRDLYPAVRFGSIFDTADPWHGDKNILSYAQDTIVFTAPFVKWNVISPSDQNQHVSIYQDTKLTDKVIGLPDVPDSELWEYYLAHDGGFPRYGNGPDMLELNLVAETTSVAIKVIMDISDEDEAFRSTIHISDPKEYLVYPNGPNVYSEGESVYFDDFGNKYYPNQSQQGVDYYTNEKGSMRYYFDDTLNCWTCIYEHDVTGSTVKGDMFEFVYRLNDAVRGGYELIGWHNEYVSLDNALNPSPELVRVLHIKMDDDGFISTAKLISKDSQENEIEVPLMVGDYTVSSKDADADGNIVIVSKNSKDPDSNYTVKVVNGETTTTYSDKSIGAKIDLAPGEIEGKTFVGWQVRNTMLDSNIYTVAATHSNANHEIIVKAIWKDTVKYTVKFETEKKGSNEPQLPGEITNLDEGTTISLEDLVLSNNTFQCWKSKSGLIDGDTYTVNDIDSIVIDDVNTITLTGVWENNYHSNYDIKLVTEFNKQNDISNVGDGKNAQLPELVHPGYRFNGWYISTGTDNKVVPSGSFTVQAGYANDIKDIILIAQWEKEYTINGVGTYYEGDTYDLDYASTIYWKVSDDYYSKGGSLKSGNDVFSMTYLARWTQNAYDVHASQPANGSVDAYLAPRTNDPEDKEKYISDWDQPFQYGDKILLSYTPGDDTTSFVKWVVTGQYYISDETSPSTFLIVQGDCTISVYESTGRVIDIMIAYDNGNLNGKEEKEQTEVYLHDRVTGEYRKAALLPPAGPMEHYNLKAPYSDNYEVCLRYHIEDQNGVSIIDDWYTLTGIIKVSATGETTFIYDVITGRFVQNINETGEETGRTITNYNGEEIPQLRGYEESSVDGQTNINIEHKILVVKDGEVLAKLDKYVGILRSELARMASIDKHNIINNNSPDGPPAISASISPNIKYTMFEGYPYNEDPESVDQPKDKFIVAEVNYRVGSDSNSDNTMNFYLNWLRTDSPADVIVNLEHYNSSRAINIEYQKDSVEFKSVTYKIPDDAQGLYRIPIEQFEEYNVNPTTTDTHVTVADGALNIEIGYDYENPVVVSYTKKTVSYTFDKNLIGYSDVDYGMNDGTGDVGVELQLPLTFTSSNHDSVHIDGWLITSQHGTVQVDRHDGMITYALSLSDVSGITLKPVFNQMALHFVTSTKAFENGSQKITIYTNKGMTVDEYWESNEFGAVKWMMTHYNVPNYVCTGFVSGDIEFKDGDMHVLNESEYTFVAQWTVTDTKTFRYVSGEHCTVTAMKDAVVSNTLEPNTLHTLQTNSGITLYIQPEMGYMVDMDNTTGAEGLGEPVELSDGRGYAWVFLLDRDVDLNIKVKVVSYTITFVVNNTPKPHTAQGISTIDSIAAGSHEYYGLNIPKYRVVAFDFYNSNIKWFSDHSYQNEYDISKTRGTLILDQSEFNEIREYQFYANDNLTLYAHSNYVVTYHDYYDTEDGKEVHNDITAEGTMVDLPAVEDQSHYELEGYIFAGWAVKEDGKNAFQYYPEQTIDAGAQTEIHLYAYYLSDGTATRVYNGTTTTLQVVGDSPDKDKQLPMGEKLKVQYSENPIEHFTEETDPIIIKKDAGTYESYYVAQINGSFEIKGKSTLTIKKVDAYIIAPSESIESPGTITVDDNDIVQIGLVGADVTSVYLLETDGYGKGISEVGKVHTRAKIDWTDPESALNNYNLTYIDGTLVIYPKDSSKNIHDGVSA